MSVEESRLLKKIERSRNRKLLPAGTECGCFHCLSCFQSEEIQTWIDDGSTALCPVCGVDAVLPGILDADELRTLHDESFGKAKAQPLSRTEWEAMLSSGTSRRFSR
jgi:hypothetical protein